MGLDWDLCRPRSLSLEPERRLARPADRDLSLSRPFDADLDFDRLGLSLDRDLCFVRSESDFSLDSLFDLSLDIDLGRDFFSARLVDRRSLLDSFSLYSDFRLDDRDFLSESRLFFLLPAGDEFRLLFFERVILSSLSLFLLLLSFFSSTFGFDLKRR